VGATGEAVNIVNNTATKQFEKALAEINRIATSIGDDSLPEVTKVLKDFISTTQELQKSGDLKQFGSSVASVFKLIGDTAGGAIKSFTAIQDFVETLAFATSTTGSRAFELLSGNIDRLEALKGVSMDAAGNISIPANNNEIKEYMRRTAEASESTRDKIPGEAI